MVKVNRNKFVRMRRRRGGWNRASYRGSKSYISAVKGKSFKKSVTAICKKVLGRKAETKQAYVEPTSAAFNTQSSNNFDVTPNITQTNMYQLCPEITLGTTMSNRIGNKINPKGLYVKGHVYGDWLDITANNESFQTIYVRIMAVSDKQNPVDSLAYNAFSNSKDVLLQKGATATNFLFNDQTSLYRPINTDRFNVYFNKVIKLCSYSANVGTANVDQAQGLRRFSFKIPMKEIWKYDDTNSRPTNISMPVLLIGYCPADNRNITLGATTNFLRCTYYTDFYYQDE